MDFSTSHPLLEIAFDSATADGGRVGGKLVMKEVGAPPRMRGFTEGSEAGGLADVTESSFTGNAMMDPPGNMNGF